MDNDSNNVLWLAIEQYVEKDTPATVLLALRLVRMQQVST